MSGVRPEKTDAPTAADENNRTDDSSESNHD
jgi:hypothetical protein